MKYLDFDLNNFIETITHIGVMFNTYTYKDYIDMDYDLYLKVVEIVKKVGKELTNA
jgi:hypothetical protein